MKTCYKCKQKMEYIHFHKNCRSSDGYSSSCKSCKNEIIRKYKKTEKYKEYQKEYNKATRKKYKYKEYGIDSGLYDEMFVLQKGMCLICGIHQNDLEKSLCIDHNHTTGIVRGLLCRNCNLALGLLKDDVYIIKRAVDYLLNNQ